MIAAQYFFLILISLLFVSVNLVYSRNAVEEFSQTLFTQQKYLVNIQDKAVLKSLIEKMQHETWVLNLLTRFKTKVINGEVIYNNDFRKPLLNILQTYQNAGDQYLMDLFKQNKTILISSWHQKDAMYQTELDQYQRDQINNASRTDFLWKSALTTSRMRTQSEPKFIINIESYFFAYMYDGMYYSSGSNITFQNIIDKPCQSGKYHFDARCREYFFAARNATFVAGYPPMLFYGGTENKPFTSCGLCKKIYYPSYQKEQYKNLFKNKELNLFSIVCNSIQMHLIKFIYEKVGDENYLKIMVDPITFRLAYQSDYQIKRDEVVSINDTYLYRIKDEEERQRFVSRIKAFYSEKMIKKCSYDRDFIFKLSENIEREEFSFYLDGKEMISIFEISYTIDRNLVKLPNGEQQIQFCYISNLIFISIMSKDQLRLQAIILEDNINTVDIIFRSTIYLTICFSIYIAYKNIRKISLMLNSPVEHLTSILKKLRVDEETKNYILFEDGMLTGDFEIESSELFLSSDMHFLYESFQNLFQTLIFTTQQIYDENECKTLIQLNKQVGYFKQFRNYRALGICYNNIGNIHLNNYRFFESLENYQMAIIYCNYELNEYDEVDCPSRKILSETNELNKVLSDEEFKNCSERDSFEITQNKRQQKKSSENFSFIQSIKKFFGSKPLLPQNQLNNQESMIKCFQKYDMETQTDQTEIYWMLFNRKFNYLKALYFLMSIQNNSFSDWNIAETLVQELKIISKFRLPISNKRDIILNQAVLIVYQQKNEIEKGKQIIDENEFHFYQIKQKKEQQAIKIFQNDQKPQKTPLNKSILLNISHQAQQENQQYSQQNFHLFTQNIQSIQLNTVQTPKLSQNSYKPNVQGANSFYKPTQISFNSSNSQNLQALQQYQKQKYIHKRSVGFNSKENSYQSQSNSPLLQKKSQPNSYYKQILSKKTPNINTSQQIDDINHYSNYDQQSPVQYILSTPVEDSFSVLNPSHSPLQQIQQNQLNFLDSLKEEIPKKKQSSSSQYMGRSQTLIQNSPQLHFSKHIYDWINDKQKKKKKRKQSKNDEDESCNSKKSHKNSFTNNIKEYPINQLTEQSHRSKKNRKNTFNSKINKKRQSKLVVEYSSDEIVPYEFKDESLNGVILEQISIFYTMIGDYFKAAETLTKYFEESKTIIPSLSYRCFQKLFGIFSQYNLSHPSLEQQNYLFNSDISFKINFVYFSWAENTHEQKNSDTSFLSQQNSFNILDQNLENESDQRSQRIKAMFLCESLINRILYKNDDYFGLITSDVEDMQIRENIALISKNFINKNVNLIQKELYDIFDTGQIIIKSILNKSIELEGETPIHVEKKSCSLQLDKKISSASKKNSKTRGTCITIDKTRQISPRSINSSYSSQQNLYEKRKSSTNNGKNKKRIQISALKNILIQNQQNEILNQKQSQSKSISDSYMQNSKNKITFKNHHSPRINLNSTKLNQTQDKQSNIVLSQSYINQAQQNATINIQNNSFQQNISNNTNNNFNQNDQNNSNCMMSYSSINKSSNMKSPQMTINQVKTSDFIEKPLEFIESPTSINQIQNGFQTSQDQASSILANQYQYQQKDSIHINLESSIESLEKEELSPIVEEVSRKNMHKEEQKKLQKLTLFSGEDGDINKLILKKSEPVLHTFTNWVNCYKSVNQMDISTSTNLDKIVNQSTSFKQIPQSEKKQFLPIQQIQFNEQENQLPSLIDLKNQQMLKKKKIFYQTIWKALQSVICQYESKTFHLQLSKIQNENLMKSKLGSQEQKKYEKLKSRNSKMYLIKNNIPEQKYYNKYFKKFIVAVTDDLKMIDQNEMQFKLLAKNLKNLEIELCILCQNEALSIKEGMEYPPLMIDDKYVISYFHCEKNLLLYLMNSRSQKNHNCIPLIVEHF